MGIHPFLANERGWRADLIEKVRSVRAMCGQEQRQLDRKLLRAGWSTLFWWWGHLEDSRVCWSFDTLWSLVRTDIKSDFFCFAVMTKVVLRRALASLMLSLKFSVRIGRDCQWKHDVGMAGCSPCLCIWRLPLRSPLHVYRMSSAQAWLLTCLLSCVNSLGWWWPGFLWHWAIKLGFTGELRTLRGTERTLLFHLVPYEGTFYLFLTMESAIAQSMQMVFFETVGCHVFKGPSISSVYALAIGSPRQHCKVCSDPEMLWHLCQYLDTHSARPAGQ